ncbi:MAG: hypothetical protein KatS3mg115_0151 [Candidatus Poribacteria bacterium]|nr:MAG: hypothetical protein KatS3mg115_0151 [Candidatus Poribacteria bacterium]
MGPIDPVRDTFEWRLCSLALAADLPILAICKGAQLLNVVAGGTMVQDINAAVAEPIQHQQRAPGW